MNRFNQLFYTANRTSGTAKVHSPKQRRDMSTRESEWRRLPRDAD